MTSARDAHRTALRLSHELCELPDRDRYLDAVLGELTALLPSDDVFWTSIDLTRDAAQVRRDNPSALAPAGMPTDALSDHPGIASYLSHPADLRPRRVSDCSTLTEWRRTRSFNDIFATTGGTFQLSLVVRLEPPGRGDGWILTRSSSDFSDDDVALASALLPALTVLDRLHAPLPVGAPGKEDWDDKIQLTPRELQILNLLDGGHTAGAIARKTGISSRTVSKHLQHIYDKLESHDRLLAVNQAHRLGLLPDRTMRSGT